MSQPLGRSLDPKAPVRKPAPRIREHAIRQRGLEPVSLRRRKPVLAPGNIILFAFMAGFGLYATGHLPGVDRFFDRLQSFGRSHNDVVVRGIVHYLPAALIVSAAVVLSTLGFFALRERFGRGRRGSSLDQKTLKAALANILRASAKRSSVETAEEMKAAAAAGALEAAPKANTVAKSVPVAQHDDAIEAARLRRDAMGAAAARAAAAGRLVVRPQPVLRRPLSDSMPTLPFNARVQRRNPRGTLPPQVAAALKVAAASPTR